MAGLTSDDTTPAPVETAADGTASKCPFLGDSQCFTWSRDIQIGQLQDEVTQAMGPAVRLAAFFPLDDAGAPRPVDSQNPLTVYVTPSSVDMAALRQAFAVHRPDPYYGMTDDEKAQAQIREKIAAGQTLTPEEMTLALQMLISG